MAVDFETPTAALFSRLSAIAGIEYTTRKLESWDDTPPAVMPSLMLTSGPIDVFDVSTTIPGVTPAMWRIELLAILYVAGKEDTHNPGVVEAPSVVLNPLLAAVVNALQLQPTETPVAGAPFLARPPGARGTTLGGLCAFCRVSGRIERAEGLIGHVMAASIPIEMVVTS